MKFNELREELETLDIPVQYRTFKEGEAPDLPYILFYIDDNEGSLKADDQNYYKILNMSVELYSDEKDLELEEQLEAIFNRNKIEYDSFESYIEQEKMYEILYEITI